VALAADETNIAAAAAQAQDEISGVWTGTASGDFLPGGSIPIKIILTRGSAGNAVTATVETPIGNGTGAGTFDPATKELTLSVPISDGPTVAVTARIAGTTMTGTATAEGQTAQIRLERTGSAPARPGGTATQPGDDKKDDAAAAGKPRERVTIDFDGFEQRALLLPVQRGRFGRLAVNDRNQLVFVRLPAPGSGESSGGAAGIKLFDLKDDKREEKTVTAGADAFDLSGRRQETARDPRTGGHDPGRSAGATGQGVVLTG
jgi:hypothetical protein